MDTAQPHLPSANDGPAWEAAYLLPPQGRWSEADFLQLHTNRMAELVNGRLEVLPMPTWLHQLILRYLLDKFREHLRVANVGGDVMFAPLPIRLFPGTIREPDLLYVGAENLPKDIRGYPHRIDLAIEIVSEGIEARKRDYEDKRADYAKAGVTEYWIVDPDEKLVTVLTLRDGIYEASQECRTGDLAKSLFLPGLAIPVDEIWALGNAT